MVGEKENRKIFYYCIYGKRIHSDLYFPQLVEIPFLTEENADIVIRTGIVGEEIKALEGKQYWKFGETFSWIYNSTCWLTVENGRVITYELREDGEEMLLRSYLLGHGLAMLHLQRGEMPIHCSALVKDGKAILVAGDSGSGKSTTTAVLLERGFSLMADDVAVVKVEDGKAICYPAFPYQKLCRDVVEKGNYDMNKLIYINEQKDKFLVPYDGEFCLEGKELHGIFILGILKPDMELYMEEITGINKLRACANNLFMGRFMDGEQYSAFIGSRCLEIASKVKMYLIGRPDGEDTLQTRVDYILEQWKNS